MPIENREKALTDFAAVHGGVKNSDARNILGVSDSAAKQLLARMATEGKLKAIGERGQRVYVLPELKPDAK